MLAIESVERGGRWTNCRHQAKAIRDELASGLSLLQKIRYKARLVRNYHRGSGPLLSVQ